MMKKLTFSQYIDLEGKTKEELLDNYFQQMGGAQGVLNNFIRKAKLFEDNSKEVEAIKEETKLIEE